jgi:hypothetical protein
MNWKLPISVAEFGINAVKMSFIATAEKLSPDKYE